jgi:peptidoglycan hydrolase CwlO-like protein
MPVENTAQGMNEIINAITLMKNVTYIGIAVFSAVFTVVGGFVAYIFKTELKATRDSNTNAINSLKTNLSIKIEKHDKDIDEAHGDIKEIKRDFVSHVSHDAMCPHRGNN